MAYRERTRNIKERFMVERHYRRRAVEGLTGLSRSTIYYLMKKGEFPRPIKLTARPLHGLKAQSPRGLKAAGKFRNRLPKEENGS